MKTYYMKIKEKFISEIAKGNKKHEYRLATPERMKVKVGDRKIAAKKDISSIIIYETTPVKRIVAEAEIIDVLMFTPEELWAQTKDASGIDKVFFDEYFKGREVAYAYKLGKVKKYEPPKTLLEYGIKAAPQSFVYI